MYALGSDLRELKSSITRSLCDQIYIQPIHWAKVTTFPETATHAIDFGAGGTSGIGPLTAHNLKGRGVRVVILGERKGAAEFYNAADIKREAAWGKQFVPGLVKTRYG